MSAGAASSHSPHYSTSIGKLGNALVAVGSGGVVSGKNFEDNLVVELWEGGVWRRLEDFPNANGDSIYDFSTVTVHETMFLVGE